MIRREFIALVSGAAAGWPFGAHAQPFPGTKRLGMLMSVREDDPEGKAQLAAFLEALAALGWIVDRNLRTDIRWGGGDVSRTRIFAKELVALQPDIILTQGTPGTAALQHGNAYHSDRIRRCRRSDRSGGRE
jgi:putative ABC transport system substrate-binding protein